MSNPVLSCVNAKTMAVGANNNDNKAEQGKMGGSPVAAKVLTAAPVLAKGLSAADAASLLSSRSVQQTADADMNHAQRLVAQPIKLAKIEALERIPPADKEAISHYRKSMEKMYGLLENPELDVNGVDENGWTALHHAASNDNQAVVSMLLINGDADKTIKNNDGNVPIDLTKPGSAARVFLQEGVAEGIKHGCTPAPSCVNAKTMAVGANNNDNKSSQGKLGEFVVCAAGPVFDVCEIGTRLSLSSGSVHQAEGTGATGDAQSLGAELIKLAKVEVAENPNTEEDERHLGACMEQMRELLNNPQVNVNQVDENGWTALHHAANSDNWDAVVMLLFNEHMEVDKGIKNKDGKVPVDLAKPDSPIRRILRVDTAKLVQEICESEEVAEGEFFALVV